MVLRVFLLSGQAENSNSSDELLLQFDFRQQSTHLREKNIVGPTERSDRRQAAFVSGNQSISNMIFV